MKGRNKIYFSISVVEWIKNLFDYKKCKSQPWHMKQQHAVQIELSQYKIDQLHWTLE